MKTNISPGNWRMAPNWTQLSRSMQSELIQIIGTNVYRQCFGGPQLVRWLYTQGDLCAPRHKEESRTNKRSLHITVPTSVGGSRS